MKIRLLALALLLLPACVTPILPQETPAVDDYAQQYNNDVRWGRWQEAASQVEPERRTAFLRLLDDNQTPFRFTACDILSAKPTSTDGTEVEMLVALEFYRLPSVKERKVRQVQHWRYDVDTKRWVVAPDLKVLGDEGVGEGPPAR
ncbi:MAG TPA: hypothetical protein VMR86_08720 [Myxococcota bacterium]|nr:hypothetical protein [Myxococcota bacterium]